MGTNKFELKEEQIPVAVRTEADRISTETRRSRRDFGGGTRHFVLDQRVIDELSQRGHLCWINDDGKGHLQEMEDVGYQYVLNREAYGNREELPAEDRVKIRHGTRDDKGNPQDTYLMVQSWKFYNEDQEALNEETKKVDQQIMKQGDEVGNQYGKKIEYSHK